MKTTHLKFQKLFILIIALVTFGCANNDDVSEPLPLTGNIFFDEEEVTAQRNGNDPFVVTINFSGPSRDRDVTVRYDVTFPAFNPAIIGEDIQLQETQEFIIPRNSASVSLPLVQSILSNPDVMEERFFNIELLDVESLTIGNPDTGENHSVRVTIRTDAPPADINDPNDFIGDKKFVVNLNGDDYVIPYFSNLEDITVMDNTNITKAIIAIHGSGKNAKRTLEGMQEAATIEGVNMESLAIIAPQYPEEEDIETFVLDDQHLFWSGGWRSGNRSLDTDANPRDERIPSFAVMDSLITKLMEHPNLQNIVLTGHSAGGQFANRYSMSSPIADDLEANGITITFIPNNPASYTYLDSRRLVQGTENTFAVPEDISSCVDYNEYRYGLDDLPTYLDNVGAETIRERLAQRNVVYLIGENDNNPNFPSLDRGCEAILLGRHRFERAVTYFNYLQFYYNDVYNIDITENQSIDTVPRVGHSSFGMYTSEVGRSYIFSD